MAAHAQVRWHRWFGGLRDGLGLLMHEPDPVLLDHLPAKTPVAKIVVSKVVARGGGVGDGFLR